MPIFCEHVSLQKPPLGSQDLWASRPNLTPKRHFSFANFAHPNLRLRPPQAYIGLIVFTAIDMKQALKATGYQDTVCQRQSTLVQRKASGCQLMLTKTMGS